MVQYSNRRLKALVTRLRESVTKNIRDESLDLDREQGDAPNPLLNYYRHKAKVNLDGLYRFALQTGSHAIRDVFAQVAANKVLDLDELLVLLRDLSKGDVSENARDIASTMDSSVLLAVADVLANAGEDDLDTHGAVQIYEFVYKFQGQESFTGSQLLRYIEALEELENYDSAEQLLGNHHINEIAPQQVELFRIQRIRRDRSATDEWLNAINALYRDLQMSEVRLFDDESRPLMDRLAAGDTPAIEGPKVSIIVPTFSPGQSIMTAIRGLLEQTWQNLEILIIDDASPREYQEIFDELGQLDPRIRVIHLERNAGAYVARNAGLEVATGTYVTTHDDDDWSHPDKIAMQVAPLVEDEALIATISAHIRTTEHLDLMRVNAEAKFLQMNYSSLMFRKDVVDALGPWDTVNRGGDSEFYLRLVEYGGTECILALSDKPLSFSRIWDGSLTSGEMSRGFFGYSRLIYRWAFRQWHREVRERGEHPVRHSQEPRPFPVPTTFEAGQRNADLGTFDVIYVSDFFRQAKAVDQALSEMESLVENGLRVGYMHLYSPETGSAFGFPERLFDLQQQDKITQVSHDDIAESNLLIVYDVSIGMFLDQLSSKVTSQRGVAIDLRLASLAGTEPRTSHFVPQALRNLEACFNTRFMVVGATEEDQDKLRGAVPSSRLLDDELIWHTHVSEKAGRLTAPSGKPVVGFHSNTNRYRWPNSLDQFKNAYVSEVFTTRFFGPVKKPLEKFGTEILNQIEIVDPKYQSERDFLKSLDFWVYWPHRRLEDLVWEPVLSAMQAGKVVILPKSLKFLYGESAVYAEENQVGLVISYFTENSHLYIKQAERGQAYVASNHTRELLARRVSNLLGVAEGAV